MKWLDTAGLKPADPKKSCRFESDHRYQKKLLDGSFFVDRVPLMRKLTIYIENEPNGFRLASDNIFYEAYFGGFRSGNTLVYRSKAAALKRLNTKKPRMSLNVKLYPKACLHVYVATPGSPIEYFLDREGNRVTVPT